MTRKKFLTPYKQLLSYVCMFLLLRTFVYLLLKISHQRWFAEARDRDPEPRGDEADPTPTPLTPGPSLRPGWNGRKVHYFCYLNKCSLK